MEDITLYIKLSALPESMKSEVSDFIDSLISKAKRKKIIANKPKPIFGSGKGMFKMKPGFDEPLEDFKDYMN